MRYAVELLHLVTLAVGLTLLIKGTMALSKVAVHNVPAPAGLKEFAAI